MDLRDDALLLLRLAEGEGGRADPERLLQRRADSPSRLAFEYAREQEWLDPQGWVTEAGMEALQGWGD